MQFHSQSGKQIVLDKEHDYFLDLSLIFIKDFSASATMSIPGKQALWFGRLKRTWGPVLNHTGNLLFLIRPHHSTTRREDHIGFMVLASDQITYFLEFTCSQLLSH